MSCGGCKTKFTSREQTISCNGYCGKLYHPSCVSIPTDVIRFLEKVPGLNWNCDKCLAISSTCKPDILKQIFEKKIDGVVKEMENMLLKMKTDVMQIADRKLEEINSHIKNECMGLTEIAKGDPSSTVPSVNKNKNANNLYSTALKGKSALIIKPKDPNQKNYNTKTEVLRNIQPVETDINISSVKNIRDGGIVVGCTNESELVKLKTLANDKLSDKYDVKDVKSIHPRIRVVGMSEELEQEVLVHYIKSQNKTFFNTSDSVCKVLKIWQTRKNKYIFQAILQVDATSYNSIMAKGNGRVLIGLDMCDVYDSVELRRCFRCSGYNHHAGKCSSPQYYCPRCSEQHQLKDCKVSVDDLKCINCIKHNEKNKDSNIDVNHAAWSSKCHVYCQHVDDFKSNLYV